MAYDPEARETSNNAMIIGVVALVLVVLGALAYYATREPDTTTVVTPTTNTERVIEREVPSTTPGTTVIVPPTNPAPATPPTNSKTETTVTVNTPPAKAPTVVSPPASKTETNVTVNTPPATKAPAGDAATSSTGNKTGY